MCNNLRTILCIAALIFAISSDLHSEELSGDLYLIKSFETLRDISSKFYQKQTKLNQLSFEEFENQIKEWNPHVRDWDIIPDHTTIFISSPYTPFIDYKYAPKLLAGVNQIHSEGDLRTPFMKKNYTIFFRYGASQSKVYEQNEQKDLSLSSEQNSALSLSLGGSYFMLQDKYLFETMMNWSHFQKSIYQGQGNQDTKVQVPDEYDFYLIYANRLSEHKNKHLFYFHSGTAYESFSALDTKKYLENDQLSHTRHNFVFVTLGLEHLFYLSDIKLKQTINAGNTLLSSATSGERFKGQRYHYQVALKGDSRFTYHFSYKHYALKGPHSIDIKKIAIGLGFLLF